MDVEFEHGSNDPQTDVTPRRSDCHRKDRLAHMKEFPTARGGSGEWKPTPSASGLPSDRKRG